MEPQHFFFCRRTPSVTKKIPAVFHEVPCSYKNNTLVLLGRYCDVYMYHTIVTLTVYTCTCIICKKVKRPKGVTLLTCETIPIDQKASENPAARVAQSVRAFAPQECSNSSRDRPKSSKHVVTAPLPNARHYM